MYSFCSYFGLKIPEPHFKDEKAKNPKPDLTYCQFPLAPYAEQNKETWHRIAKKYDLDATAYDHGECEFKNT